ncbi:DUF4153 domain-containing protein [Aureimonas populi]|uniref:DUF4153 domain-containing protein n=1 Tax=Aureimonas populi TaxID=1701758 RepID=A0ABW5CF55_9HYPH|nr:DUF4153 domain-containing protein [Aureimonas populi]
MGAGSGATRLSHRTARLLRSLGVGARMATARFPVATLLIVAFAVVSNLEVSRFDVPFWPDLPRLLSALGAAAAASVAVRVGLEPRARAGSRSLLILPLAAALVLGLGIWSGRPLAIYAPALLPAAILSIPLAPFLRNGTAREFWSFALWTGVGVTLAFLSVLLFLAGLLAILEMVRFLFQVGFGSSAYNHIFVTAFALVGPLFALGRIPQADRVTLEGEERLVETVRPLFDWVAAPLALATAVILHLYALRIAVTGQMPVGEVGWIVSFFSLLVLSLRVAIHPFLENAALPARLFGRFWALMLIVPLILLALAAWLRIEPHGFTVARYYLVLGGTAAAVAVLLQAFARTRGDIRWLAGIAPLFLALSVIGPWSVGNIVGRSQSDRIEGQFVHGSYLSVDELRPDEQKILRSRIMALGDVGQLWRMARYLPPDQTEARAVLFSRRDDQATAFLAALGLRTLPGSGPALRSFSASAERPIRLAGYDIAVYARSVGTTPDPRPPEAISLRFEGAELVVEMAGGQDRFDLTAALGSMPRSLFDSREAVSPPVFDLSSAQGRNARLRFDSLMLGPEGEPAGASVTLLLREAQWPSLGGG